MARFIVAVLMAFFVVGCATVPESIKGTDEEVLSDYTMVKAGGEALKGKEIRLGGVIASVQNLKDNSVIEVVSFPLTSGARPNPDADAQGRFLANVKGFIDPVQYAKGRLITVLGHYAGTQEGKVGEYRYTFPVIDSTGSQLWRVQQRIIMDDINSGLGCPWGGCIGFGIGVSTGRVQTVITP